MNLWVFFLVGVCLGCSTPSRLFSCPTEIRAAVDIGSGTTKLKIAEVCTDRYEIRRVLAEEREAVPYRARLLMHGQIQKETLNQGLAVLTSFREIIKKYNPRQVSAVATEVFRQVKDVEDILEGFYQELGVNVQVLTPELEGQLAWQGALSLMQEGSQFVVWDIGGGSQQWIWPSGEELKVFSTNLASVSFRNQLMAIQGKEIGESPNPVSHEDSVRAHKKLSEFVAIEFPSSLKDYLNKDGVIVIGVGGVHQFSILGQLNRSGAYRLAEIDSILPNRFGLDDEVIGGSYADVQVSNLILVSGLMKALGVTSILVGEGGLVDSLLLNPL